jgi:hypothetical protein
MIGYLKALFDWFTNVGGILLKGSLDLFKRFKWFFVAVLAAVLAPLVWVLQALKGLTAGLVETSESILQTMQGFGIDSASGLWGGISAGAALMNCVVPLSLMLSSFGGLLTLWLLILSIKTAVWVYRLIPFKAS